MAGVQRPARATKMGDPNLDLGHPLPDGGEAATDGANEAEHPCSDEKKGGGFGCARRCSLRGDGEIEFDGDPLRREFGEDKGASCDHGVVDLVGWRAGRKEWGDQHRAKKSEGGAAEDVVEVEAVAGRADAGEEGDVEGVAADAVGGASGSNGGEGDEMKLVGEGVRGGQGEGEGGVGVAGEGGVEGVGVGGYG